LKKNYRIKIPSKQLIKIYSTFNYPTCKAVEPRLITGITYAEGSFSKIKDKNNKRTPCLSTTLRDPSPQQKGSCAATLP